MDALRATLRPDGGPRIAIVSGDGGVGKSRLVEDLIRKALEGGWGIAHGRAYPVESGVPYALFADAFLPLLREMDPETLSVLTRGGVAELAYLFPALAPAGDPAPPRVGSGEDPSEFRTRLRWNFSELLRGLAAREPLLVALEDLQWADDASLQLLHFVARQAGAGGLAFVCTYNEAEREADPRLPETERSLLGMGSTTVVRLGPLSAEETLDLVCRTFDVEPVVAGDFAAHLFQWTRGNPFFVEETLKALVQSGRLHERDGTWLGWEAKELELPRSVRDAVLGRLRRLSAEAGRVADAIAVAGSRTSFLLLSEVTGLEEGPLLGAVEELCAHRILSEAEVEGAVVYDFVHPLVRQTLYAEMGLARTRVLHGAVAEALEGLHGGGALERADELAYHFARTDGRRRTGKAVRYLAAAGRRALARHADREAANYLEAALRRSRQAGFDADEAGVDAAALLPDLGRAYLRLGEYDAAIALWEEARRRGREAGSSDPDVERALGLACFWSGRHAGALERFAAGLEAGGDAGQRARLHLARGVCLQELGRADESREDVRAALALAEELGDASLLARAHRSLALLHTWTGPPAEARRHGAEAIRLAEASGDRNVEFWSVWGMATLAGLTGDTGEMARWIERARGLAEELRSPVLQLWAAEISVERAYATGDWDAGLALGERAIALARSLNQRNLLPRLLVWTAILYMGRGDLDRAREHVEEAGRVAGSGEAGETGETVDVHTVVPAHIGRAHYLVATGDHAGAIAAAEEGLRIAEGTGYTLWALHRLLPILAEAHLWAEDPEGAARVGARMREHAERLEHTLGLAWADACDAMVRWKVGDPEGGAVLMRGAAEALEAIPWVPDAARVRRQLAGRLAEIGDREGALKELRAVHDVFARLGAESELEKARIQFREVGSRPPLRGVGEGAAGLTSREVEVARLVAAGKSNKAAARELGISPRTVSTHLSNIFQKLELGSRAELARAVREERLLERR